MENQPPDGPILNQQHDHEARASFESLGLGQAALRAVDDLARKTLHLDRVRLVILDEADEMLSMGFIEDIQAILGAVPAEHQTALFSATLAPRVIKLAQQHLRDPERISVASQQAIAPK